MQNIIPATNEIKPGLFGTNLAAKHSAPPKVVTIKAQPPSGGVGMNSGRASQPAQPTEQIRIKQPPPGHGSGVAAASMQYQTHKALLIGISYELQPGLQTLAKGGHSAMNFSNFIKRLPGREQQLDIRVLKDTSDTPIGHPSHPTYDTICDGLRWLTSEKNTNAILYYCGHSNIGAGSTGDALVPVDFTQRGVIGADMLSQIINSMSGDSKLTCLFDAFRGSGPIIELPYGAKLSGSEGGSLQTYSNQNPSPQSNVTIISELPGEHSREDAFGTHTSAFAAVVARTKSPLTIQSLLTNMMSYLRRDSHTHGLLLSSSRDFDNNTLFEI